jgi:hypothetical protein
LKLTNFLGVSFVGCVEKCDLLTKLAAAVEGVPPAPASREEDLPPTAASSSFGHATKARGGLISFVKSSGGDSHAHVPTVSITERLAAAKAEAQLKVETEAQAEAKKIAKLEEKKVNAETKSKVKEEAAAKAVAQPNEVKQLESYEDRMQAKGMAMSIKELKRRLTEKGVAHNDCVEKKDLVSRLFGSIVPTSATALPSKVRVATADSRSSGACGGDNQTPVCRVISLENMVDSNSEDLYDDELFSELIQDTKEECSKFGTVIQVHIPRPTKLEGGGFSYTVRDIGKVFVEFKEATSAAEAQKALNGRAFAGEAVRAEFCLGKVLEN